MAGTSQRYNLPDWIYNLDPDVAIKLMLYGMFGQTAPTGTGLPVVPSSSSEATGTLTMVAATASSTTNIPIGAFNVGIIILTGTGTVGGVDLPALTPLNINDKLAAAVSVVLGSPGTARISYLT